MRRVGVLLAVLLVPWTVLVTAGEVDLVFAWGLVNPETWHVTDLYRYLFVYTAGPLSLPRRLLAWPIGTLLYLGGVANALVGRLVGPEDRRVTAGLVALAGLSQASFALGLPSGGGQVALPVAAPLLAAVAWWLYRDRSADR